MTHKCEADGTGEPKWRIYFDLGKGGDTLHPGAVLDTRAQADALVERARDWADAYDEYRVVQVCPGPEGTWLLCGGRDSVRPASKDAAR